MSADLADRWLSCRKVTRMPAHLGEEIGPRGRHAPPGPCRCAPAWSSRSNRAGVFPLAGERGRLGVTTTSRARPALRSCLPMPARWRGSLTPARRCWGNPARRKRPGMECTGGGVAEVGERNRRECTGAGRGSDGPSGRRRLMCRRIPLLNLPATSVGYGPHRPCLDPQTCPMKLSSWGIL
jgi:hypothetical protein